MYFSYFELGYNARCANLAFLDVCRKLHHLEVDDLAQVAKGWLRANMNIHFSLKRIEYNDDLVFDNDGNIVNGLVRDKYGCIMVTSWHIGSDGRAVIH